MNAMDILKKIRKPNALSLARSFLVAEIAAMLVSTSAAVGIEFLIYLTFILSPELWRRLRDAVAQPMVRGCLAWGAMLVIAGIYCVGGPEAALGDLASWRKLLLLPLAAAVFDEEIWKNRIIHALILTATLGVGLSYFSRATGITIYKYPVGISVHNHASQGMAFAVSLFAIIMILRLRPPEKKWYRIFLAASGIATFLNLIFITDGRSGYLVLLVVTAVAALALTPGKLRYILAIGLPLAVAVLLTLSPVARNRIHQGINEAANYQKDSRLTSMGVRMAMWKNTIKLVGKSPLFGYGSGGFDEAYRRQVQGKSGWQNQPVASPHNQFLRIMAEQGIFGLLVFLAFLATMTRQKPPLPYRVLALGVLLAWCGTSMFSDHFSTFFEGRFIFLWCGALLAFTPAPKEPASS